MYDSERVELARAQCDLSERTSVIYDSDGFIMAQTHQVGDYLEDSYGLDLTNRCNSDPFLVFCFVAVLDHAIAREKARRIAALEED